MATEKQTPPVCLAAELAQVEAADLAAALGASFPAQVAAQRAIAHQRLREHLIQRQVVAAQPPRPGRRELHLGVTVGAEHGDGGSVLLVQHLPAPGGVPPGGHRERLQLADTVQAEGVQAGEDLGLPVQALTHVTHRPRVPRQPVLFVFRVRSSLSGVLSPLLLRHFVPFW